MKILLVGAGGTLGRAIAAELGARHQIVGAGRTSGAERVDLTERSSIDAMFERLGSIDAVVSAAGKVRFAPLETLDDDAFRVGLDDKLMGQVNLAQAAVPHLSGGGSITLVTGVLSEQPIAGGASATMVNRAIEGFVRAAAIELPRGIRINAVSPNVFVESLPHYGPWFRGFEAIPVARAALAFARSVEGRDTGQVYKVW